LSRIDGNPLPPDGPLESAAEDPMDLADARVGESFAPVLAASLVAVVPAIRPMLDVLSTVAMVPTFVEPGVQRLEQLGIDPGDLHLANERPDVFLDLPHIPASGRWLDVEHVEPAIQ